MKVNKNTKIGIVIIAAIGILSIGALGFHSALNQKTDSPSVEKVSKQHNVTDALANTPAIIYDTHDDLIYRQTINSLKSGTISSIILLMYSDTCPLCNSHAQDLAKYVKSHSNDRTAIIAVDHARQVKGLNKDFDIPSQYHYPAVFTYTDRHVSNSPNSVFRLKTKKELYR